MRGSYIADLCHVLHQNGLQTQNLTFEMQQTPLEGVKIQSILIIPPHPDDECLMASLALRLRELSEKNQQPIQVQVLPYSFGSNPDRVQARQIELKNACSHLKFELIEGVASNSAHFIHILNQVRPDLIITSCETDRHATHIQTAKQVQQVIFEIQKSTPDYLVHVAYSEFWGQLSEPNLIVPLNQNQVELIFQALTRHKGEVARSPYHLTLPGFFMDQARRAEALSFGQKQNLGAFAQLFHISSFSIKQ